MYSLQKGGRRWCGTGWGAEQGSFPGLCHTVSKVESSSVPLPPPRASPHIPFHPTPCWVLGPFSVMMICSSLSNESSQLHPHLLHPPDITASGPSWSPPGFVLPGRQSPRPQLSCSLLALLLLHVSHPFPVTAHQLGQWRGWPRAARQIIQGSGECGNHLNLAVEGIFGPTVECGCV